ncbi:MAG: hypothetical protein R6V03_10390 [Kiritimatiellia bacterium]
MTNNAEGNTMTRKIRFNNRRAFTFIFCLLLLLFCPAGARAQIRVIEENVELMEPENANPDNPGGAGLNPVSTGARKTDLIAFLNGDRLHGRLLAIDPENTGVKWHCPNAAETILFGLDGISEIALASGDAGNKTEGSSIRLTNGDLISGKLVSLRNDSLVLDTWYAGTVTIKRPMIRTINPGQSSSIIVYEGPRGLAEWTIGRRGGANNWRYKDSALYALSSSSIARNIPDLPDRADIEFEAAWWGPYPSFYCSFYTDNLDSYSGNCYSLRLSGTSVYMYRYTSHSGSRNIGNISVQSFSDQKKNKALFNLLVDKENKSVTLLIDGVMMKQWTDQGDFAGRGNGILFQPQSNGGFKISNIKVTKWDGKLPEPSSGPTEHEEDLVRFVNGDKVSGELQTISDNKAVFKTSYAALTIPVQRIATIYMSEKNAQRARRNKGDIMARFREGGRITMRLARLEEGRIYGESENFGNITVPTAAFDSLEFNIYDKEDTEEDNPFGF